MSKQNRQPTGRGVRCVFGLGRRWRSDGVPCLGG